MNRRLLLLACAALTLLFASTPDRGRAQTAPSDWAVSPAKTPSPFDDVSAYTWPYVAVDTLQKAGIVIGYPDGTYGGRPTMTRYEFAVSIARVLPLLAPAKAPPAGNSDMNALHGQMQEKFEQSPLAPNAMLALMDEFQPELLRLGQADPANGNPLEAARQQLKLWKSHQETDGRSFALTPAQARSPFADVPADDPVYGQMDALQKAGVLTASPNSPVKGAHILTRLQLATEIARLVPLRGPLPGMPTESGLQALPPPPANLTALLTRSPQAVTALTALLQDFTPELGWLDRDASAAQARLAILLPPPFLIQDVPANAWPFSAVDTLQKAGIVIGYLAGTYEGNHTLPRREFAVMVVRLMPLSLDAQAKLEKSPGALAALVDLINEFRPEIVQIFASVATLGNPLPRVEEQLRLLRSRQSRVSPITPANITPHRNLYGIVGNNWPYIAMNTLHNAGVINYLGDGNGSRLLLDRYNFAFLIAHVLPLLSPSAGGDAGVATGGTTSDLKTDLDRARRDTITKLTENPPVLNALIALVDEFAPELKFLRQDVPVAQRRLQTMQTKVRQETYAGKRTLSLESASSPFADVPSQDIAFDCLDVLQGVGIPIRATDRPVVGKVPMTRLQCGTAIAGLMPFSLPRLVVYDGKRYTPLKVSLPQDLQSKLQQSPLALDALMTLVIEFTPELKLLGQDVDLIQSSLRDVRQSVANPIPGQPARASDELPRDNWTYAALNAINKDGVPFGYHMGDSALKGQTTRSVQSGLTRYEFAVSVARILPLVETPGTPLSSERPFYLSAALQDDKPSVITALQRDLESRLAHNTEIIDALQALLNEFRPELLQLHVDVPTPHMRLDNIEAKIAAWVESEPRRIKRRQNVPPRSVRATPFPDVPPNHWAFSAVEALRQSGIVVGYPKGAYHTDDGHE